jgi:hypothetical protein
MWTAYLNWGLADFSGDSAVDELYDGPFCVLSIVDNHTFKRLLSQVLDPDPDHTDITAFFQRFRMALRLRGLTLRGVTTDGSPLYPEPLRAVCGAVPHQICEFHMLKELTTASLRAVAQVRKPLAARQRPLNRGRPFPPAAQRAVRQGTGATENWGALCPALPVCPARLDSGGTADVAAPHARLAPVAHAAGDHGGSLPLV